MADSNLPIPASYKGVMVSSTFTDLVEHRKALIQAIDGQKLKALAMENDAAKIEDVIESSLQMVREASAYIGVISRRYGQIPEDKSRNPNQLSLTELEFNEAQRLNRPTLIFIMGEEHPLKERDVEREPEKIKKLEAFRERAKRLKPDSSVHRIYQVFNSLDEFTNAAIQAVAELRRYLDEQDEATPEPIVAPERSRSIFISYRRIDSKRITRKIYDLLAEHFSHTEVFRDLDTIPAGVTFKEYIKSELSQCQILIAVIGPRWLQVTDREGKRRLDDPNDWVRLEIEYALKREIPVIPLLINDTKMPKVEALPELLKALPTRHAARMRHDFYFWLKQRDVTRLIGDIEKFLKKDNSGLSNK